LDRNDQVVSRRFKSCHCDHYLAHIADRIATELMRIAAGSGDAAPAEQPPLDPKKVN